MRGNRLRVPFRPDGKGPIPACAGESPSRAGPDPGAGAYPRVCGGIAALSAIPRPEVFVKAESLFCSNLSALGYAANGIDIGAPLTLIFSAYVLRFVIRRLPVIG